MYYRYNHLSCTIFASPENDSTPLGKRQKSLKAVEVSKTFECNQISKEPVASSLTAGTEVKLAGQRSESEGSFLIWAT